MSPQDEILAAACNALDKAHGLLSSVMRYEAGGAIELPPLLAADIQAWIDGEYDPGELAAPGL